MAVGVCLRPRLFKVDDDPDTKNETGWSDPVSEASVEMRLHRSGARWLVDCGRRGSRPLVGLAPAKCSGGARDKHDRRSN